MSDKSAIQKFLLNLLLFNSRQTYLDRRKSTLILNLLIPFFCLLQLCTAAQNTDTLYFNKSWQICEKPFAEYYRFGKIVIDTFWYYTGPVRDYYLTDTIQMEGEYSAIGYKEGHFSFYYPSGKMVASGNYSNNMRTGSWEFYHPNGMLHYRIIYNGDDVNFAVMDNIDSSGNVLAKDGTGTFKMRLKDYYYANNYNLTGEFLNGNRHGTWKFDRPGATEKEGSMYIEEYSNGEFKKGKQFNALIGGYETYKKMQLATKIIDYDKFATSEAFAKDRTSFRNTQNDQDLAEYLINRQAPAFSTESESFEESFFKVLSTLNNGSFTKYFSKPDKMYNGQISINVSDSGDIEDVEITGNLDDKEKEYMLFFIKKFKNIHDLAIENVAIDAYHKIYFYTVDFQDFFKGYYKNIPPIRMFLFNYQPYDQFKIEATRKLKKKKRL